MKTLFKKLRKSLKNSINFSYQLENGAQNPDCMLDMKKTTTTSTTTTEPPTTTTTTATTTTPEQTGGYRYRRPQKTFNYSRREFKQ